MKLQTTPYILLLLLLSSTTGFAQTGENTTTVNRSHESGFYTKNDSLPNIVRILPHHPTLDSPLFYNDWYQYTWGKKMRIGKRYEQAVEDADYNKLKTSFSGAMGIEISPTNTPEIWKLLDSLMADLKKGTSKAKNYYNRRRPFAQFNEVSGTPESDKYLRDKPSFPSSHTTVGWGLGLVLAEINPECMDSIFSRAYQIGVSRVIVGVHYQSDVDAGRLVASMVISQLHSKPEFTKQLAKAKNEFLKKKRKTSVASDSSK